MNVKWSERALNDVVEITRYIAQEDPVAADELVEAIFLKSDTILSEHPLSGRSGRIKGVRELVVHKNFVVAYAVSDNVDILAVMHTARLWPQ